MCGVAWKRTGLIRVESDREEALLDVVVGEVVDVQARGERVLPDDSADFLAASKPSRKATNTGVP